MKQDNDTKAFNFQSYSKGYDEGFNDGYKSACDRLLHELNKMELTLKKEEKTL